MKLGGAQAPLGPILATPLPRGFLLWSRKYTRYRNAHVEGQSQQGRAVCGDIASVNKMTRLSTTARRSVFVLWEKDCARGQNKLPRVDHNSPRVKFVPVRVSRMTPSGPVNLTVNVTVVCVYDFMSYV